MKNVNITRINKMGKIMKILAKIAMVLVIIGSVALFVSGGFILSMPNDTLRIEGDVQAQIYLKGKALSLEGVPSSVIRLDDESISISENSMSLNDILTLQINEIETGDDTVRFAVSSDLSEIDTGKLRREFGVDLLMKGLMLAALAVALGFAAALSKALQNCETPFNEEVVKRMKHFAFSMIPYAALGGIDGAFGIAIFAVALILLIFVFSYGCSIQSENDNIV